MAAPFRGRQEPDSRPRCPFYIDRNHCDSPPPPHSSDVQQPYVPHTGHAYPPRSISSPPPAHNLHAQDALQPLDPARLAAAAAILSAAAARLAGGHSASPAFGALDAAVVILAGASSASGSRTPSPRETPAPSPSPRVTSFIPVPPTPLPTRRPPPIPVDRSQSSSPDVAPRPSPPPPPVTSSPPIQHHEVPSSQTTSRPQPQPQRRRSQSKADFHVRWADGRTGYTPSPSTVSFPHESDPSSVLYASGYRPSSSLHPAPGPRIELYGPEARPGYVGGVCWLLSAGEVLFDVTRDHVYWRHHLSSNPRQVVPISQLGFLSALSEPAREVEVVMVLPHSSAHTYGRLRVAASNHLNVSVTDVLRALHDELMTPLSTQEIVEMHPALQRRLERNRDERQGPSAPLRRVHYLDGARWLGMTTLDVDGAKRWWMRGMVPLLVVTLCTWEVAERLTRDV